MNYELNILPSIKDYLSKNINVFISINFKILFHVIFYILNYI